MAAPGNQYWVLCPSLWCFRDPGSFLLWLCLSVSPESPLILPAYGEGNCGGRYPGFLTLQKRHTTAEMICPGAKAPGKLGSHFLVTSCHHERAVQIFGGHWAVSTRVSYIVINSNQFLTPASGICSLIFSLIGVCLPLRELMAVAGGWIRKSP